MLHSNWTNIKLLFCREVRDQLRDRRTLFMIAVLPLLLYPLLGMSLFQVAQFIREQSIDDLAGEIPSPAVFYSTAKEKSQLAYIRVTQVLRKWTDEIGRQNLATTHLPASAVKPFEVDERDVAEAEQRNAAMWSKILP